jgi:hypothetical protein
MKTSVIRKNIFIAAAILAFAASAQAASFTNGGFEDGNLGSWTGGGGYWSGSPGYPVNPTYYAGGTSNNTLMNGGVDPITGLNRVYNGNYSVRVNDSVNNYSVSTIKQSVTNYTANNIFFEWQAVLQGSHGTADSDYFSLTLHDDTAGADLVKREYSSASAYSIFGLAANNSSWYTNGWTVENVDLAALNAVGHDFTLTLLASDCPYGGHAGYVYLDGFADVIREEGGNEGGAAVPEPSTMLLLGGGLAGLAFWRKRKNA